MMTVHMRASCAVDIPVSSITLFHEGVGSATDLARVYVLEGTQRVSRTAVPTAREGKVTVRLRSFSVRRCEERTLTVVSDIDPTAAPGGEHRLMIRRADDIGTGVKYARIDLRDVSTASNAPSVLRAVGLTEGSLSVSYLSVPLPITYGSHRSILRFKLVADNRDDQEVTALTLTNQGKARDADLIYLFLSASNGEVLTEILPSLDGDRARFTFDPALRIGKNDNRILILHADVRAPRTKTLEFTIEEPGDIETVPLRRAEN